MKQITFCIICIVSILVGNNSKKYLFKNNTDLIITSDTESFSEMSIEGNNMVLTSSMRQIIEFVPAIDNEDYEQKMISSFSSVISTLRENDKSKPNHDIQKLNGCIFTSYLDSMGVSGLVEGNNDIAKEMIDSSEGTMMFFAGHQHNYYYPLGSDSLRSVGETWQTIEKEVVTEDDKSAMGDYVGTSKITKDYTFKKIKEKKGELIAYIDLVLTISSKGVSSNWGKEYEINFSAKNEEEIRFNLTQGYVVRQKTKASFKGTGKNLESDATDNLFMSVEVSIKNKYKKK